jgi:general secretion pathway protein C
MDALLVAALGLLLARIIWIAMSPTGAVSHAQTRLAMAQSDQGRAQTLGNDPAILARVNRFRRVTDPSGNSTAIQNAPPTSLNLKLKGVRAVSIGTEGSDAGNQAMAIIQLPDKHAESFAPGDTIIEGVTLDRVLPDRVLIVKSGALETLMMESGVDSLAVVSLSGQDGMIKGAPRAAGAPAQVAALDRSLLSSLSVTPEYTGSALSGYRISAPGSPDAMSGTGLQSGDVITVLDGTPVSQINIENISQRLSNGKEISMTVMRNGASVPVTLRFPEGE